MLVPAIKKVNFRDLLKPIPASATIRIAGIANPVKL